MLANFWCTSQCSWMLGYASKPSSSKYHHETDLETHSARELDQYAAFCADYVCRIGREPPLKVAQKVLATAMVYVKRVLREKGIGNAPRPDALCAAALLLASKVEEAPITMHALYAAFRMHAFAPLDSLGPEDLLKTEYFLMDALGGSLFLTHPYVSLKLILYDIQMLHLLDTSWSLVNDSFRSNLCLVHPPHAIAVAAICVAVLTQDTQESASEALQVLYKMMVNPEEIAHLCDDLVAVYNIDPLASRDALQLYRDAVERRSCRADTLQDTKASTSAPR